MKRLLVALFVLLAAAPFAYLLLALVLGLLPVNRDFLAAREDESREAPCFFTAEARRGLC